MQSFLIGTGAVAASALPWLLTRLGVSNQAPEHMIPASVRVSFYLGAIVFFVAVVWKYSEVVLTLFASSYVVGGLIVQIVRALRHRVASSRTA